MCLFINLRSINLLLSHLTLGYQSKYLINLQGFHDQRRCSFVPYYLVDCYIIVSLRIKTNGSLPRDKRGQFTPPSPSYSSTPPASPLDILHNELLKQTNQYNFENVPIYQTQQPNNYYENVEITSHQEVHMNGELRPPERGPGNTFERSSPYENVQLQQTPPGKFDGTVF